ncbi:hypothetical protein BX285_4688 [Streptomyces sp. 1114.5]|uniref:hypothetical protein n=1 Tax=unclassified Streptomyces TaxID=2593676 RepID=UPI000BD9E87A|nr:MULTISPECIES: hypothetical protein [unclassified Streptomyces]RKT20204.1 hypothetical protein BX285_4688 [Streptomyces sp. 1114.5]SOB78687.1 hypothetical protein SAMN06272789_0035 [Streptomyces sp. 1331.2]
MPDAQYPFPCFQLNEVVQDFSRPEDGKPREGVFVEVEFGKAILRPLGANGPERRVDLGVIRSLDPREIAPGTCGKPHRRPFDGWPL